MRVTNWFALACGGLQIAAAVQFYLSGSPRLAAMNVLVGLANAVMATASEAT